MNKFKKFIEWIIPPARFQMPVIILTGILVGAGITAFHLSNASSYWSDEPRTCINCHLMTPHFATWQYSSHGRSVTCGDCHVPHDNFFNKYMFKASDGMRHATVFTLHTEPDIIQIKPAGVRVVQDNCIRCHEKQLGESSLIEQDGRAFSHGEGRLCWDCHRHVPHGIGNSQTSTPYAQVPDQTKAVPDWINEIINTKK
ncbi:cytochrome c nitrite reductase small subunit [Candidatus Kapaibacterium sp.]